MMVKKKKKQSRSQSSTEKKTLEPNLLSIFHSKLANGKDLSSKSAQGLSSSQSRVVRCPKCHKFLQEPVDVTIYKCSGCNSILQAKHWELKNNDKDLFSSQNSSLTPVRSIYRKYSSRTSPSVETANRRHHETSYIPREWIRRRADEFIVTGDFASSRSCSGVVKLSITKKEDTTTLLDLLRFVDSASDCHLSRSDKGSGDRTDDVNQETFEDKESKERDTRRSTSSEFYDLKLEAFQPSMNHKLREQQQPATRIHLEQESEEEGGGGGSKTPVRSSYRKYSSRASSPLFERGYMSHETSYIRREWLMMTSASPSPSSYGYTSPFHESQVSSSSAAASPNRFQGETSDQKNCHWSSQQSQMHDDSQLSITKKEETHQDDSDSSENGSGDRVDVVMWETFEDKGIKKENIRSISSKFIDLTFQPQWNNHKLRSQASLGSGEILVYKKETMSDSTDRQVSHSTVEPLNNVCETNLLSENTREFDLGELKWEDIIGELLLEKSPYTGDSSIWDKEDTNEALEPGKDGCVVSLRKTKSETFKTSIEGETGEEERSLFQHMESQNESSYYEGLETVERRWEDRAGLHLEEYETNYTNPFEWSSEGAAPTFHMEETFGLTQSTTPMFCLHEPELLKPDNEADGSLESSSTGFFNSHHESSNLRAVLHQEEVMSDSRTEVVSVKLQDIFEWTSQRAPTFRLYDEPALIEPDQDAYGRSESSSNDHVIPKERQMMDHDEDEPWLVELDVMAAEDGPSLDLEKFENEKMLLEDQTVEPREDIFRLSIDETVEQDWVKFDSETSLEDMQVNLRQTFKQGDTEENIPASGPMAQAESEAEEEILRNHLDHFQKKNEKSGLTSEPYAHLYNTTEPSEVVGLRHALYQTQTSPLTSPIDTPRGSPMHILMHSPMHAHIVSPLRSPTNSSGSLSDGLFFGKKT